MSVKDKTVFNVPILIDGEQVADMWFAHGTSDSCIATIALANPIVQSILGNDMVVESINAVPFQPVNIITKLIEETDHA